MHCSLSTENLNLSYDGQTAACNVDATDQPPNRHGPDDLVRAHKSNPCSPLPRQHCGSLTAYTLTELLLPIILRHCQWLRTAEGRLGDEVEELGMR